MASGFEPGSDVWAVPKLLISDRQKSRSAICAINFFSTGFIGSSSNCEPQGLKPRFIFDLYGTAEAVPFYEPALRVDPTLPNRIRHAVNRQHVSSDAVVDVVSFGVADNIFEGRLHDGIELFVDHRLLPEVALTVLHPFEIRSGDATGVGQNVGDHEDTLIGEDIVCRGGRWPVRTFRENAALHAIGIAAGDDVLGGRWDKDFAVFDEQIG